jgi:hypothetical protein
MRGSQLIGDKLVTYGFFSFKDWIESVILSFPAPWSIAPLNGKYYGTQIIDRDKRNILVMWQSFGNPSEREIAEFAGGWTPAAWSEYRSDCHWESEFTFKLCQAICLLRNNACDESDGDGLLVLVQQFTEWDESVWKSISCDGPDKRALRPQGER